MIRKIRESLAFTKLGRLLRQDVSSQLQKNEKKAKKKLARYLQYESKKIAISNPNVSFVEDNRQQVRLLLECILDSQEASAITWAKDKKLLHEYHKKFVELYPEEVNDFSGAFSGFDTLPNEHLYEHRLKKIKYFHPKKYEEDKTD